MIKLFKLKSNGNTTQSSPKLKKKTAKLFPISTREWNSSIYSFNKNSTYLTPISSFLTLQIINIYFTLYNRYVENKLRTKKLLYRFRRLSSNKIYISDSKLKYTNNKITIVLYMFNRQKSNYILAMRKWFLSNFNKKDFRTKLIKKFSVINTRGIKALENINKQKFIVLNNISKGKSIKSFGNISDYLNKFYLKLIKKSLRKLHLYIYYKQLVYLNRSKYNYNFLQYLAKYLEFIHNKNVEFNIVNLNKFYLNSDIISNSLKLKIVRNRRKLLKYINVLKNKVYIKKSSLDNTHSFIERSRPQLLNNKHLNSYLTDNVKYKHISGFRVETKGRLTRRNTASRYIYKYIYKGNLLNIDSSYKGLSSVLLKGNLKSNIQSTKLSSKSRIGSFGIKTWISGK